MEAVILELEHKYQGNVIAGVDEAGRGPLVGPVVAAAVIVDQANIIPNIKDSKKLSRNMRGILYDQITKNYIWSVAVISHAEIDKINILEATRKACVVAIQNLTIEPEIVLVDGNMKFLDERFISIVRGDNLSISIAAASIVAKVTRDHIMLKHALEFPQYLWDKNYGYGTKDHIQAIKLYGVSPYHRHSFKLKSI